MRYLILFLYLIAGYFSFSQSPNTLNLSEVKELAKKRYPAWKQGELLEKSTLLQKERLRKTNRPEVLWEAKGSIQSEAIEVPFSIPGQEPIKLPLVNGQTYGEVRYLLYDGGMRAAQKNILDAKMDAAGQTQKVAWQSMLRQVYQSYFGAWLLQTQLKIFDFTIDDVQKQKELLEAGFKNGVVLESDLLKLEVKLLQLTSQQNSLNADRMAAVQTLAYLTGKDLDDDITLESTSFSHTTEKPELERPELTLFDLQKAQIMSQEKMIGVANKPKISAFGRVGVGYPNPLNFFDTSVSPFGLAGLQMSWSLFDWGKGNLDRENLKLQSQILDSKKETFTYQVDAMDNRYYKQVAKIQAQIEEGKKITALQKTISEQLAAQLENGIITATEYLQQVNTSLQSELQLEAYQVMLQQVIGEYKLQRGL